MDDERDKDYTSWLCPSFFPLADLLGRSCQTRSSQQQNQNQSLKLKNEDTHLRVDVRDDTTLGNDDVPKKFVQSEGRVSLDG